MLLLMMLFRVCVVDKFLLVSRTVLLVILLHVRCYDLVTMGNNIHLEIDVLFSNDTGKLGKRNSECSRQESNLRPSDY